jgi:ribosome-associated protein
MDSKKLALLCLELADNKKAEDLLVLDVRKLSSVTDYYVIVTGSSEPHIRAISNEILDRLREDYGEQPRPTDVAISGGWLVLDFFDVIVHIMRPDSRKLYDLEGLWGDAPAVRSATEKPAVLKRAAVKKKAAPAKRPVSKPRKKPVLKSAAKSRR